MLVIAVLALLALTAAATAEHDCGETPVQTPGETPVQTPYEPAPMPDTTS